MFNLFSIKTIGLFFSISDNTKRLKGREQIEMAAPCPDHSVAIVHAYYFYEIIYIYKLLSLQGR
jgi:hypothetical protein